MIQGFGAQVHEAHICYLSPVWTTVAYVESNLYSSPCLLHIPIAPERCLTTISMGDPTPHSLSQKTDLCLFQILCITFVSENGPGLVALCTFAARQTICYIVPYIPCLTFADTWHTYCSSARISGCACWLTAVE